MSSYTPRNFNKGGLYHIYNQGVNGGDIFLDDSDFIYYLNKVRTIKDKFGVSLICYCLMPNHIHLLLRQNSEKSLSRFISSLHLSYCVHFNKKYNRIGHLFKNRFKHKHIKNKNLLKLSSYIHLNPLVNGHEGDLKDYQWSSYPDYIRSRNGTLCQRNIVMRKISLSDYKEIVEEETKKELFGRDFQKLLAQLDK